MSGTSALWTPSSNARGRAQRSATTSFLLRPSSGARDELLTRAQRVLSANWREGIGPDGTEYAFTCPGPPRYRHQWYWDSCFHAIVWRLIDATRVRDALRTLLVAGD